MGHKKQECEEKMETDNTQLACFQKQTAKGRQSRKRCSVVYQDVHQFIKEMAIWA